MKYPWFQTTENRTYRLPYGGLLLGALCMGGIAATAFWLFKEGETQKRDEWTRIEPLNSGSDRLSDPSAQMKNPIATISDATLYRNEDISRSSSGEQTQRSGKHQRGAERIDDKVIVDASERELIKMVSVGEELRDHDFALPDFNPEGIGQTLIEETSRIEPEKLHSGGAVHTKPGDDQSAAEVPAILDQTEATPDFHVG
jgi:hypothetical protein